MEFHFNSILAEIRYQLESNNLNGVIDLLEILVSSIKSPQNEIPNYLDFFLRIKNNVNQYTGNSSTKSGQEENNPEFYKISRNIIELLHLIEADPKLKFNPMIDQQESNILKSKTEKVNIVEITISSSNNSFSEDKRVRLQEALSNFLEMDRPVKLKRFKHG